MAARHRSDTVGNQPTRRSTISHLAPPPGGFEVDSRRNASAYYRTGSGNQDKVRLSHQLVTAVFSVCKGRDFTNITPQQVIDVVAAQLSKRTGLPTMNDMAIELALVYWGGLDHRLKLPQAFKSSSS